MDFLYDWQHLSTYETTKLFCLIRFQRMSSNYGKHEDSRLEKRLLSKTNFVEFSLTDSKQHFHQQNREEEKQK